MNSLTRQLYRIPSPAKLNLFLHITGRRQNGYHELQTIFQLIDLYDYFTFQPLSENKIEIEIQGKYLNSISLQDNLIYQAAQCLFPYQQHQQGYQIILEKHIPMGAGLGGGSSNAATTLLMLNQLWQCQLSQQQLMMFAAKLGADVPIFVHGRNAWAEGIGEYITTMADLPQKSYLLLKPDCFVSTAALFSHPDLQRHHPKLTLMAYQQHPELASNDFEVLVRRLYPNIDEAFLYLNQYGQAKLTGTGACVFMNIDDKSMATQILQAAPCLGFIVNSLSQSSVFSYLDD